jgi:hypothetical protein
MSDPTSKTTGDTCCICGAAIGLHLDGLPVDCLCAGCDRTIKATPDWPEDDSARWSAETHG